MKLSGKVAIITGGASGIGQATARLFAQEGAKVVVADRSEAGQEVSDHLKEKGYDSIYVRVDVTKEEEVQALVERTVQEYGKLDIMFANAGVANDEPADQLSLDKWQRTIDVNLTGVFLSDKHAVVQMLRQGTGVRSSTPLRSTAMRPRRELPLTARPKAASCCSPRRSALNTPSTASG